MNDEKLIELVRQYPPLFEQTNSKYMDSNFKNALWKKIGAEMKTDGHPCKSRWSNIRDNYRKSLQKRRTNKDVKPYKYSDQLKFLGTFFTKKETLDESTTNIKKDVTNKEFTVDEANGQDCTAEDITDPMSVESSPQNITKQKPPRKKTKLSGPNDTTLTKIEAATLLGYMFHKNEKNKVTSSPPQHPVDAFLAGVAPALKKLPHQEWHYAKGEIFDIVQKYEFNVLSNQHQLRDQLHVESAISSPSEEASHSGSKRSTSREDDSQDLPITQFQ